MRLWKFDFDIYTFILCLLSLSYKYYVVSIHTNVISEETGSLPPLRENCYHPQLFKINSLTKTQQFLWFIYWGIDVKGPLIMVEIIVICFHLKFMSSLFLEFFT